MYQRVEAGEEKGPKNDNTCAQLAQRLPARFLINSITAVIRT